MTTMRCSSLTLFLYAAVCLQTQAFSVDPSLKLFDRFRCTCPADRSSIRQFDASLQQDTPESTWVAVYRSNNNKPSILLKDEFFHAMRMATGETFSMESSSFQVSKDLETPLQRETPVAVARLHPSPDYPGTWVLDKMQCALKKEDTNEDCDGGSEHAEALSVAIDVLLLHHLQQNSCFEQAIRCKGTLVSSVLLEKRGFQPVENLCRDMATHISSLDASMECYADRVISTKHVGARTVALQILSELGRLDRNAELEASRQQHENKDGKDDEDDEYDPWAGMRQFI